MKAKGVSYLCVCVCVLVCGGNSVLHMRIGVCNGEVPPTLFLTPAPPCYHGCVFVD